jgi:hypothetical protein
MSTRGKARARIDLARGAHVVSRTPLLYRRGADPALDRPAHVRAGSGLAAWNGHLAVVQDDACFLAIIDTKSGLVDAIPFPGDGRRQFDDARGNKGQKLDLEAVFVTQDTALLVALGSGSSPLRERVVLIDGPGEESPRVTIVHVPELYAQLRADRSFSGSELNIEGAALVGDDIVLFQRGNGAPSNAGGVPLAPVDATARIALAPLLAYFRSAGPVPPLRDVIAWELGGLDNGPSATPACGRHLTFTDGAVHPSGLLSFLACAEDSPDAVHDGPVSAVALGFLDEAERRCELGAILEADGTRLLDKAEGLAFDPDDPTRAFVVTDRDDPDAPSELLVLRLGSAWAG